METRLNGDVDRRYYFHKEAVATLKRKDGEESEFPNIIGLAAVYFDAADPGTEFRLADDFYERIMPGAFDRAIREKDDVRGLFNHDANWILGRTSAGTMTLSVDHRGLRYEIDPPENQNGKFVTMAIERGDVTGSSFAFMIDEQVLRTEKRADREVLVREIESVSLFDVSPVTFPAYEATSVTLSSRSQEAIAEFRKRPVVMAGYPVDLAKIKRLRALTQT